MRFFRSGLVGGLMGGLIVGLLLTATQSRGADVGARSPAPAVIRNWSDSTGRFHMEGSLIGGDEFNVRLQKTHGSVVTVEIRRLSPADRSFVRSTLQGDANPSRATTFALGQSEAASSASSAASQPNGGWMASFAGEWTSLKMPTVGGLNTAAIAGRLITEPAPPMPENIVYIRLSRNFLQRMTYQQVAQPTAINDTILDCSIAGMSRTVGATDFEFVPSDHSGLAEIRFVGSTSYDSVADGGPVQVLTSGVTRFASAKAIRIDAAGVHLGPAVTNARTSSTITGVRTSLPGLRGRIALRIGRSRAAEEQSTAQAITADHTRIRINQAFDRQANHDFAELSKKIAAQVALLSPDDPLRRCSWQATSTKDALQIVLLAPSGNKDVPVAAPPNMMGSADVEIQVHVALVRRVMSDANLQQLLQPMTIRLASQTTASPPPERPEMRWSNDYNWLSLGWSSGNRPSEPSQPRAAVLASQTP